MNIMEIITNPIVWALLVWLFSRLFTTKNKEDENKSKTPNQPQNRSEQKAKQRSHSRPVPKPVMTTVGTKQKSEERRPPLQTVQEAYEKMKKRSADQGTDGKNFKKQPVQEPLLRQERPISVNRNVRQHPLVIDRNKAAQGVIWSEVLGPPRAKNPHYTKSRRQS